MTRVKKQINIIGSIVVIVSNICLWTRNVHLKRHFRQPKNPNSKSKS